MNTPDSAKPKKVTTRTLRKMHRDGKPIVTLTAYDATMAYLLDSTGEVDVLLVGDTLGMMALGYPNTVRVTLQDCLHHSAAVARVTQRALVVGDMPFMSYHGSLDQAVLNAGRYLQEAGADAVKLEGGVEVAPLIRRMTDAGIPVMGHIGLLPQRVIAEGGYRLHGKTEAEAAKLREDALALQEAGVFAMVLECMPAALSGEITRSLEVPTIGIGSGAETSGQVQVINDILGLFEDFTPKHTKHYANLAGEIRRAAGEYAREVRDRSFPGPDQSS